VYDATISGWEEEHRGGVDPRAFFKKSRGASPPRRDVALRLSPRSGNGAVFTTVPLANLPRDLGKRCHKLDRNAAIPEWEKRDSFPVLLAQSSGVAGQQLADPYEMRQEFLALSGDLDQLADFAREWGLWDSNRVAISHDERIAVSNGKEALCIFPHLIQQEQAEYGNALCGVPELWLSQPKRNIFLFQQKRKPYFFVYTDLSRRLESCPAVISATITLDLLSGSQFRYCAREACQKPFKLETGHDQIFCKRACAHAEAAKAYRERAKAEKAKKRGTSSVFIVKGAPRKQGDSLDVSLSL
jgi:hypothetical protein